MASSPEPAPPKRAVNETEEAIEVDDTFYDNDSTFESVASSATGSLTDSLTEFTFQFGRRYHSDRLGNYAFPNDDRESERLDCIHEIFTMATEGKLYLAPLDKDKIHNVLDIGTGTGIWAIEFGDEHPEASVIGVDITPIQPSFVPPNVKFEVDDVDREWAFTRPFDYVHSRYMNCAIFNWPHLVKQTYDNLTPGGWCEFQDIDVMFTGDDGSVKDNDAVRSWLRLLSQASNKLGRDPSPGPQLEKWITEAGFVNVVHRRFKIPFGTWPKDPYMKHLGAMSLANTVDGLEGWTLRLFCEVLGWSVEEVQVMLAGVRKLLISPDWHGYYWYHVVYGQKPGTSKKTTK